MTIKKLTRMPYAQAHVEIADNGDIYLFSYVTLVAEIRKDEEGAWLYCYGLYSNTTRKHISAFMREYTELDYQTAKQMCVDKMHMNLETGEVRDNAWD